MNTLFYLMLDDDVVADAGQKAGNTAANLPNLNYFDVTSARFVV